MTLPRSRNQGFSGQHLGLAAWGVVWLHASCVRAPLGHSLTMMTATQFQAGPLCTFDRPGMVVYGVSEAGAEPLGWIVIAGAARVAESCGAENFSFTRAAEPQVPTEFTLSPVSCPGDAPLRLVLLHTVPMAGGVPVPAYETQHELAELALVQEQSDRPHPAPSPRQCL